MYTKDVDLLMKLAEKKSRNANERPGKYLGRAIVTGFYVIVAIILSYTTGAILYPKYPEVAKVMVAATFSFALALIVFLSGELFTGNNLVMSLGVQGRRITIKDLLKVWVYSYIGNFIGCLIFSYLFVKSGAALSQIQHYMEPLVASKLDLSIAQMILRGILCNFIVCLGYLSGIKMQSESGKLIMMFFCVFAFIIAGFEHSVANMGVFSIGYFALGGLPLGLVFRNLLWVTIGNIIGGAVLLAFSTSYISYDEDK